MLTIREVADKLNCSPQAIYKKVDNQLNNQLKPFIKEVERGKRTVKMIEPRGFEIIKESMEQPTKQPVQQPVDNGFNEVQQLVEQPQNDQTEDDLINILQDTLEVLKSQLEVKDNQLQIKDKQLESKDEQIKEISSLLKDQQKLNENNQVLLREDQKQRILEQQKFIEEKTSDRNSFVEKIKRLFSSNK